MNNTVKKIIFILSALGICLIIIQSAFGASAGLIAIPSNDHPTRAVVHATWPQKRSVLRSQASADKKKAFMPLSSKDLIVLSAHEINKEAYLCSKLHAAAGSLNSSTINLLLKLAVKFGIKNYVNIQDNDKATPLHYAAWAVQEENVQHAQEIIQDLLTEGANINALTHDGQSPLDIAQQKSNIIDEVSDLIEYLIKNGALTGAQIMANKRAAKFKSCIIM